MFRYWELKPWSNFGIGIVAETFFLKPKLFFNSEFLTGFATGFFEQTIKTFAREKAEYQSNIYPKNSPLVPLFNK